LEAAIVTLFRSLVLCYHAASETWSDDLSISAEAIERQITDLVRRGYRGATAGDVVLGRSRDLHVTFDDAYPSVLTVVPALLRLGVPATMFACTGYAEEGRPLDVPEVAERLAAAPGEMRTMDWDALRDLADRGVEVGSHTVTHPHLPRLDDAELERELVDSRLQLEERLGRPCRFVAYPFGDQDDRVREAARRAGYEAAFGLAANARMIGFSRYAIPRVDLYRKDGRTRFSLKTSSLRYFGRIVRKARHGGQQLQGLCISLAT
jgi:peptidoglycan/xylan/chitin deacetylase (PgdA/CDA1 family)